MSQLCAGYLCVVSLGGMYHCEGGLGGRMVASRTHLLKNPVYQYGGRMRSSDRVRSVYIKVERVHHQKIIMKAGCSGSHLQSQHLGGWSRRITMSWMPTLATEWDPVSKKVASICHTLSAVGTALSSPSIEYPHCISHSRDWENAQWGHWGADGQTDDNTCFCFQHLKNGRNHLLLCSFLIVFPII